MTTASLEGLQRALEEVLKLRSLGENLRKALMEGLVTLQELAAQGVSTEEAEGAVAKAMFNQYLLSKAGIPLKARSPSPEAIAGQLMEKAREAVGRLIYEGPRGGRTGPRREEKKDPALHQAAKELLEKVDEAARRRRENPGGRW